MLTPPSPTFSLSNAAQVLAGRTVLQVIPELGAGGAERTTLDIASALTEVGARALVATEGGRLVSELQARGGIWIPFPARTKNPFRMALNVYSLAAIIRRENVDIVHARSRAPAWVALGACRLTGKPFVTTYHGAYSGSSRLKTEYNSIMARGDVVIANSEFTAQRIAKLHPYAESRIVVVHRGTDPVVFSSEAVDLLRVRRLRESWGVGHDERIVLLAARLTSWKGQRVLIDAAEILKREGLNGVRFVMVGDPQGRDTYVKELDEAIVRAGLEGVVIRTGHCTDMPAAYMASAAVTVCSTEPEAFGRVAAEAQLLGKPVVVSDLGAATETVLAPPAVLPSDRTGWKVPPGDATALAESLRAVLELRASELNDLGRRARTHVASRFSLNGMCSKTLDIYADLLEAGHNRG